MCTCVRKGKIQLKNWGEMKERKEKKRKCDKGQQWGWCTKYKWTCGMEYEYERVRFLVNGNLFLDGKNERYLHVANIFYFLIEIGVNCTEMNAFLDTPK